MGKKVKPAAAPAEDPTASPVAAPEKGPATASATATGSTATSPAAAETVPASSPSAAVVAAKTKLTKPDEAAYLKELALAEKELEEATANHQAIKAKIDSALPSRNKDQPSATQQRRQQLIAEATEIRQKQAGSKNARASKQDQIKALDERLRSLLAEQKVARAKVPFKTIEELDAKSAQLEKEVNDGRMKLVEEKHNLAEISRLRTLRRSFTQMNESQKHIDELRAKIKQVKDDMDDPAQKGLGDRYNTIQDAINALQAQSDEAYQNLSALRDERARLNAVQQDRYTNVRRINDDYYARKKAFATMARQRQRDERDRYVRERRRIEAERVLGDASVPAYGEEMRRAAALLQFLDPSRPSSVGPKSPLVADSGLGAQPSRTVDDSGLQGTRLVRKDDREEEYLPAKRPGGKKRNRGPGPAADPSATTASPPGPASTKAFNCPPSVMADCSFLGLDPPMGSSDVAGLITKLEEKLEHWKADQAAQTQRNIDQAKKEIERLEREGVAADGPDTAADANAVTAELAKASIADEPASPLPPAQHETVQASNPVDVTTA